MPGDAGRKGAARVEALFVSSDQVDVDAALDRLHSIAGELRAEVAAAEVSRRKIPELVFRVRPRLSTLPLP